MRNWVTTSAKIEHILTNRSGLVNGKLENIAHVSFIFTVCMFVNVRVRARARVCVCVCMDGVMLGWTHGYIICMDEIRFRLPKF